MTWAVLILIVAVVGSILSHQPSDGPADASQVAAAAPDAVDTGPELYPPLSTTPIEPAAEKKAYAVPSGRFCDKLGPVLRGKENAFQRAMIVRAATEFNTAASHEAQRSIAAHGIKLGVNTCYAIAAWGRPERVNSSSGSYGTNEQWVYPADYLYFENGVLTSVQSQR